MTTSIFLNYTFNDKKALVRTDLSIFKRIIIIIKAIAYIVFKANYYFLLCISKFTRYIVPKCLNIRIEIK